jgi:hypothetical protein
MGWCDEKNANSLLYIQKYLFNSTTEGCQSPCGPDTMPPGREQVEQALARVQPEMVDFGSVQGLSDFETGAMVYYFEDFKRAKTSLRAKRCHLWMGTNQIRL